MTSPVLLKKKLNEDIYKDVDLDGVVVTGTKIKMTYRGDGRGWCA